MPSLISILYGVTDPRSGNATRHDLVEVLTIALTAPICGCETWVEFADFGENREDLFREFLSLKNGLPSQDPFSRLFRLLDPEALSSCFGRLLEEIGSDGAGVIAIDGKTLRQSFDRAAGRSALHVVTAFASEAQLVLAQKAVAEGSNEIIAARELLKLFDCKGALVTADAIYCNSATAGAILERGGDYLLALKENRPVTLRDVKDYLADPKAAIADRHETVDASHGRVEMRRHTVVHDVGWLFAGRPDKDHPALPALKTIGMIEAIVERDGRTTRSLRYHLSSARLSAPAFAKAAGLIGVSRTDCTGFSTWPSTGTGAAPERITPRKTSRSSESSPSISSKRPDQTSPSDESENDQDGPKPCPKPSSAKCDSRAAKAPGN